MHEKELRVKLVIYKDCSYWISDTVLPSGCIITNWIINIYYKT